MSIQGGRGNSGGNMAQPFLHEFKKQASFFLKEKIKTARLALTDVTPTQIFTEEATNGNPGARGTKTLKMISKAAFEVDDYWRIVGILHKKFNWGLNVRKKSERILKLLEDGQLLKEERNKSRKISRGIEGFGSFNIRTTSSGEGILEESAIKPYGRSNSQFNQHGNEDDELQASEKVDDEYLVSGVSCISFKENMAPSEEMHKWNFRGESKALLDEQKAEPRMGFSSEEDHPFSETDRLTSVSLLSSGDQVLQACQLDI